MFCFGKILPVSSSFFFGRRSQVLTLLSSHTSINVIQLLLLSEADESF